MSVRGGAIDADTVRAMAALNGMEITAETAARIAGAIGPAMAGLAGAPDAPFEAEPSGFARIRGEGGGR